MSILQFIVDMKWALFALLLLFVLVIWVRRMKEDTKKEVRKALLARGWKANLPGGFGLEAGAAPAESATNALAPDVDIARAAGTDEQPAPAEEVATIRRDAVTQLMTDAAQWGWAMGAQGFPTPPRPVIVWQGEDARISYATGTPPTGVTLTPVPVRPHAGNDSGRGSTGGRGGSAAPGGS